MFKKVLFFATLCTLAACSGDVYDEIDQQNEQLANEQNGNNGGMQTNSFEDNDPGWINIGGSPFINIGSGYQSPWDIWFRNDPFTPVYAFSSRGGGGHTSPLKLEIIPWVGLAYYDDNDDGIYDDLDNPGTSFNLAGGNYPNLFFNNQEVGNLVPADPITLDGSNIDESELTIASDPSLTNDEHLLANPGNKHLSGFNNLNKVFRFSSLTPQEQDLLMKYGKVFYYEVRIFERSTGNYITTEYVQYRNGSLEKNYANYIPTPYTATIPTPGSSTPMTPVLYYKNQTPGIPNDTQWGPPGSLYPTGPGQPGYSCNSREVVINKIYSERRLFSYNGVNNWNVTVVMAIGSHLWRTSGPMLIVQPN